MDDDNNTALTSRTVFRIVSFVLLCLMNFDGLALEKEGTVNAYRDANVRLNTSNIKISFAPGTTQLLPDRAFLIHWIREGATAVADYYHGFPVNNLDIVINVNKGSKINGTAYPGSQPLIILQIGTNVSQRKLVHDWVLVHEMVHLAFPGVSKRHHWIEEGLATYIEPIVRVQAGLLSEQEAWRWLIVGTPKGQPETGDKGLDNTPTWGRTYWGGALFCLRADYLIRKQTHNQSGLGDALRAITKAGGTMHEETLWPITKAFKIGDKATKTHVLMNLYEKMKDKPFKIDLQRMWQALGVTLEGKTITFNRFAPEASLRHAMMSKICKNQGGCI